LNLNFKTSKLLFAAQAAVGAPDGAQATSVRAPDGAQAAGVPAAVGAQAAVGAPDGIRSGDHPFRNRASRDPRATHSILPEIRLLGAELSKEVKCRN